MIEAAGDKDLAILQESGRVQGDWDIQRSVLLPLPGRGVINLGALLAGYRNVSARNLDRAIQQPGGRVQIARKV